MKCSLGISNFLEEISSLYYSLFFLIFSIFLFFLYFSIFSLFFYFFLYFSLLVSMFFSISFHCSLKKAFLSLLAILWNSAFRWVFLSFSLCLSLLFFSQLFVRPPQTTIFPFCISFSWGWSWSLPPVQCHEPPSIVLQALFQIKSLESVCHFHCIIKRDLIGHTWMV